MLDDALRLIKRLAVFLPGIGITYLFAKDLYPLFERRLPISLAILATYLVTAYMAIPAFIRLIRIISPPKHVPYYSVTPDGFASDPINVGLIGTRQDLVAAMTKIGWHMADPRTPRNILKLILCVLIKQPYPSAPFSTLYLLGRSQDVGFQLPAGANPRHRHHVRFWAVTADVAAGFEEHAAFWRTHHSRRNQADHYLWLGAASLDTGISIIRHNAQLTHMIHHDTNAERELIIKSLKKAGLIQRSRTVKIGEPYSLQNRVIRGYLQSDGKLTIAEL